MATVVEKDCIQITSFLKRNPTLTRAQFYDYWQNTHAPKVAPWGEKYGLRRYHQVHCAGTIVPSPLFGSAPITTDAEAHPNTLVEFDGIAVFLIPSLEQLFEAFKDPYYIEVIEPDEHIILDKEGPGNGVLASHCGKMVDILVGGESVVGDGGKKYREVWDEFERKNKQ